MNNFYRFTKILCLTLLLCGTTIMQASAKAPGLEYYSLRIYRFATKAQQAVTEKYLKDALLPALHRLGINKTCVMRTLETDTTGLKVYVLIPFKSAAQLLQLPEQLEKDAAYQSAASEFTNLAWDNPAYARFETVVMEAFKAMPAMKVPDLTTPKAERIYELRSYESASEKLHLNKVKMFSEGGEIKIFESIGANPVFFGHVVAGSHMPNLMYLTTYANKVARDEHWKVFKNHPEWKKLSAAPEYQKNVSHSDILFLQPADYSDL